MNNQTKKTNLIIVAFYASTTSGCDYATQTIEVLGENHIIIGFALGEPITWKDIFSSYKKRRIVEKHKQYTLFRPFFVLPGQRVMFIKQMNYFINAILLRTYISLFHPQKKKYFWFFEPFFMPIFLSIFSSYITIFDCVDYFFSTQQHFVSHMFFALQHATHVFVNSHTLYQQLRRYRSDITAVPLGFAYDLFHQKKVKHRKSSIKSLRIGFVGGIDDRLDFKLLYKTAQSLKDSSFIFVGKNYFSYTNTPPIVQSLYSLPNVTFVDEVRKSAIPAIIQSFDICLIPYDSKQPFNRYCFPMKIFEYFYYGKPVISTDILELRKFRNELFVVSSYKEMIQKIKLVMRNGWPLKTQKTQKLIAVQNSWERKLYSIENVIF